MTPILETQRVRLREFSQDASRRVAENIGMHEEKTTILDDYPA
jgi:hypothetical protein